jgi:uncharacterized protein YecT (DUF1311 family)
MNAIGSFAFAVAGAAAVMAAAPSGAHAAPSFDCRRASTIVEKEICGIPEFGDLDKQIATLFTQALAVLSPSDADALRADQRVWLKTRDDCGDLIHGDPPIMADVYGCLHDELTGRVTRLRAMLDKKQFLK